MEKAPLFNQYIKICIKKKLKKPGQNFKIIPLKSWVNPFEKNIYPIKSLIYYLEHDQH